MIRPGSARLRFVVAIAVTAIGLAACSNGGGDEAAQPRSPGTTTATTASGSSTASSTPRSSTTRSSSAPTGSVPGDCTAGTCPALPVPTSSLMQGDITADNAQKQVPAYLASVLDDLDGTWGPWFDELGWGNPDPGRVLVESGETFRSSCTDEDDRDTVVESDTPNAFFCPLDAAATGSGQRVTGSVILPVETFVGIWTGTFLVQGPLDQIGGFQGEFTAATVVAHEYGHAVVDRIVQAGGLGPRSEPRGENAELIADCLAGNWAATVLKRHQLSIADITQAVALLQKIGDPAPGQGHGTATQRIGAISLGFFGPSLKQGQPVNCFTKYWPEVFG
ncbi:neutral zinc metallopeptidase [Gordonia sp. NPDC003376]